MKKKKRIVCLIESLGAGGAERQISYLAGLLKEDGEDVELWTYYPNSFNKSILDQYGVPFHYLSSAQNKIKRLFVIRKALRKHHANVVISYLDTCSIMVCVIKLLGLNARIIVSERSSTQKMDMRTRLKYWLFRWADFVVPNSYTEASFIKEKAKWLSDKTRVIVNYVDVDRFLPRTPVSSFTNTLHLIGVGRITSAKNLICLAESISLFNSTYSDYNVTIDWYGEVTDHCLKESLENKINELGINSSFVLFPQEKRIELRFPEYEAFCLPSIYEGFPNVVCEAMSCGLPVICSRVCDNESIIEDGVNGILFNPLDPSYLVNAFSRYIKEIRPIKDAVGKKNRTKIMEICSRSVFVDKYKQLIYNENSNCW